MSISPLSQSLFPWSDSCAVMGIINATEDSFSGDGIGDDSTKGVQQGLQMIADGATILDIGGESTRRYALYYDQAKEPPKADEEIARVIPIIAELCKKTACMLSIDTNKPAVAEKAVEAGARFINYAWGGTWDDGMLEVAKQASVPICLMHNASSATYSNIVDEVCAFLVEKAQDAEKMGIPPEHILLDPGIGFQKSVEDSLLLLREIKKLTMLPYPILLGASRKSVIWKTLQTTPDKATAGSLAIAVHAVQAGVKVIRTHDVWETSDVVQMTKAITSFSPVS